MNWTAVQALLHTFAIAHHAHLVFDDQEILIYEPNKIIFHHAKLIILPCPNQPNAACVRCIEGSFPPTASMEQLQAHVSKAYKSGCPKQPKSH